MLSQIFLIAVTRVILEASALEEPVVKIPLGLVTGRHIKSYGGRTVTAFEGIPYAKPPVQGLRFKEPQAAEPWAETLVANKTYVCMQYTAIVPTKSVLGTEDCLYLYIYVPKETIVGTENLDVVVHIHGGAFVGGDPKSSSGPEYIMDRDLVYVSMNYRLGILGFLSTEDKVVPGNNGLKDQVLAMKWLKDNIKYFGGNPTSITLVGMSSGAACVHYHYLSPLSKDLFHGGLSQSGTVLNHWSLTTNPQRNAHQLGDYFGCSGLTSELLVDCLRTVPGDLLTLALGNFFVFANVFPSSPFGPVIEHAPNAFLSDHPYKLLKEGKVHSYPWITSNVKDEGIVPVGFFILFGTVPALNEYWNELSPYTLGYNNSADDAHKVIIAEKVKDHYLHNKSISEETIHDLVKLFSDRLFIVDGVKAAQLHANVSKAPVYYYFFDYHLDMPVPFKANLPVVAHGDDSKLLYHQTDNPDVLSDSDRKMKDVFIDFLYNFATQRKLEVSNVEWKPVSPINETINFLHLSAPNKINMESWNDIEALVFWDSLPIKENEKLFA